MKNRYMRKNIKQATLKILMIPLLLILSFMAVNTGITMGNVLYNMDTGLVKDIDPGSFKLLLNTTVPMINSVYNSGNSSVSITGELRALIGAVFGFKLDSPVTILNAQSPLFSTYYNLTYLKKPVPIGTVPPNTINVPTSPDLVLPSHAPSFSTPEPGNFNVYDPTPSITVLSTPTPTMDVSPISSITWDENEDEEKENSNLIVHDRIQIDNYTSFKIDIARLLSEPFKINFARRGPKVLIYHTHTSESFVLKEKDIGKNSIPAYNKDDRYNVVRVGEELARNLKKYGIGVLHNGTEHDVNFPSSYSSSLKTLQKYVKSYPSIRIFFDVHRDGRGDGIKLRTVTKVNGRNAARIMFVVGTNGRGLPHPEWRENLSFALRLQQILDEKYPGLAKPVLISKNRYNQQVSNNSLIIEIGGDGNLLSECLESTKYLADAVNSVVNNEAASSISR